MAEVHGSVRAKALGLHASRANASARAHVRRCTQCSRLLCSQIRYGEAGAALGRASIDIRCSYLPACFKRCQHPSFLHHWRASFLDAGESPLNWRCARPAFKQFSSSRQVKRSVLQGRFCFPPTFDLACASMLPRLKPSYAPEHSLDHTSASRYVSAD